MYGRYRVITYFYERPDFGSILVDFELRKNTVFQYFVETFEGVWKFQITTFKPSVWIRRVVLQQRCIRISTRVTAAEAWNSQLRLHGSPGDPWRLNHPDTRACTHFGRRRGVRVTHSPENKRGSTAGAHSKIECAVANRIHICRNPDLEWRAVGTPRATTNTRPILRSSANVRMRFTILYTVRYGFTHNVRSRTL